MKKRNRFLKIVSSITSCLAICGIFCCSIISSSDKKTQSALAVGGMPENQIADINNYNVVGNFTGKFDFNWSYLTYEPETYPTYSSISHDLHLIQPLQTAPSYDAFRGLVYVANESFYRNSGSVVEIKMAFYRIYNSALTFISPYQVGNNSYMKFEITGNYVRVYASGDGDTSHQTTYVLHDGNGWVSPQSRVFIFTSVMNNITSGYDARNDFIKFMFNNGVFYNFYDFQTLLQERTYLQGLLSTDDNQYNSLLNDYNNLKGYINRHYIVNVNSHYELTYNLYWNSANTSDFYIKPTNIRCVTDVDVSNASGSVVEFRHGLVDESQVSSGYYYNSTQCLTFLCLESDENSNLLRIYFYTGDNQNYGVFNLTHVNNFISNYQYSFMSDISYTDNTWFRDQVIYYKDIVAGLDDFSNGAYQTGYDDGYASGYTNGNNIGYVNGKSEGYQEGLETNGTVVAIFSGILQVAMVPVNFFLAIFNFEILGINISAFVQALLTIMVTIIVLRTIFGGKGGSDS